MIILFPDPSAGTASKEESGNIKKKKKRPTKLIVNSNFYLTTDFLLRVLWVAENCENRGKSGWLGLSTLRKRVCKETELVGRLVVGQRRREVVIQV